MAQYRRLPIYKLSYELLARVMLVTRELFCFVLCLVVGVWGLSGQPVWANGLSFSESGTAFVVPRVNVGVGTAAPAARLELVGTGTTAATRALTIRDSALAVKLTVLDNGNVGVGSTAPQAKLAVDGTVYVNGNIGIGSSSPGAALDVTGVIRASAVNAVDISAAASTTIDPAQNGVYFYYTYAATGTITLPSLSAVNNGFTVTIVRKVAQSLTVSAAGTDALPFSGTAGPGTIEMRGNNIASLTIMKVGGFWNIINKTDDCVVGKECWHAKMIYVGTMNGSQYFTTPGCSGTTDASCTLATTDSVTKQFAVSGCNASLCGAAAQYTDQTSAAIQATLASTTGDSAFKFCADLNANSVAGQTDWYLPAQGELDLLYKNRVSVPGFYNIIGASYYWSSTEFSTSIAWYFYFSNGYLNNINKTNLYYLRCVRRY